MSAQDTFKQPSANGASTGLFPRGTFVVLAATLVNTIGFGGLALISVFMAPMEADLGWTRSDTSLGYAFSAGAMAVGSIVWGRLSDRLDIRLLLMIGATGMVSSLFIMATLHSVVTFYVASLVYAGFGFSILFTPLLSTSGEWFPHRRGLVAGVVTAGGALGQGLLPFVASLLIEGVGWRLAFAAIGSAYLASFALSMPVLRWPQGTKAPAVSAAGAGARSKVQNVTVTLIGLAAFLCCVCMGVPLIHMANYIGMICGSPAIGVSSLLIAMSFGTVGRVCFGAAADRIGPLPSYAIASAIQSACVSTFPALEQTLSFMTLSAVFGFGFAGNMTCISLCVRRAVPANRFGTAHGAVLAVAWVGMASGGYVGGLLFDATQSYSVSFILAGIAGALNLMVLAALGLRKWGNVVEREIDGSALRPINAIGDFADHKQA
jgi:MFS family permease